MVSFFLAFPVSVIFLSVSLFVKINNRLFSILYILIISLISAFRPMYIPDTLAYANFFQELPSNLLTAINSTYFEPGFVVFSYFIKILGANYRVYFFIVTSFSMLLFLNAVYRFDKEFCLFQDRSDLPKSVKPVVALALFFISYGFPFTFITLRSGIAFSFICLATAIFQKNKLCAFILYCVSVTFHTSALLMLPTLAFFLSKRKIRVGIFYVAALFILFFYFLGNMGFFTNFYFAVAKSVPLLALRFSSYISEEILAFQITAIIRLAVLLGLGCLAIKTKGNTIRDYIIKTYFFGCAISAMFSNVKIVGRLVELYLPMLFVLLSYRVKTKKHNIFSKALIFIFMFYFMVSHYRVLAFSLK